MNYNKKMSHRSTTVLVATLFFVAATVFCSTLTAGQNSWTGSGPHGGSTSAIAIDPQSPSTLYAGSPFGVLKSTDGASSWAFSFFRRPARIWSISVNPQAPNEVAASGDSIFVLSNDSGQSWKIMRAGEGADMVFFSADGTLFASYNSLLQKSRDLGTSWAPASSGLPSNPVVRELVGDLSSASNLYALANSRIFKSTDGGNRWTATASAGVGETIALAAPVTGTLLAGGTKGIAKTTNDGSSWTSLNSGLPAKLIRDNADLVTDIATDIDDPAVLYATLLYSGIYRSLDGGANWQASAEPASSSTPKQIVARGGTACAASENRGVLCSVDRGLNWIQLNRGYSTQEVRFVKPMPDDPLKLFAGTFSNGLFVTADRGRTWSAVVGLPVSVMMSMAVAPSDPSTIYLGTGGAGLWKSSDRGESWVQVTPAIGPAGTITYIEVDPTNALTVYAALLGAGVYKSIDGGRSWTNIGGGLTGTQTVDHLSIDPVDPLTIWVPLPGGTSVSRDGGMTWTMVAGIGASRVLPTGTSLLIASNSRSIFRSTDGGTKWTPIMNGLPVIRPADYIQFVRRDSLSGALYAYVLKSDVVPNSFTLFRSVDNGTFWKEVIAPPIPLTVYSLTVNGPTIYVGSHLGIYEMTFVAPGPRRRAARR